MWKPWKDRIVKQIEEKIIEIHGTPECKTVEDVFKMREIIIIQDYRIVINHITSYWAMIDADRKRILIEIGGESEGCLFSYNNEDELKKDLARLDKCFNLISK